MLPCATILPADEAEQLRMELDRTLTLGPSSSSSGGRASSSTATPAPSHVPTTQGAPLPVQPPASSSLVKFHQRPGYGEVGKPCWVKANHFLVDISAKELHQYDVSITPEGTSKQINRVVIKQLVDLYRVSHLGNRLPAYDGRKSIYTAGPLPFESKTFVIKLVDKEDSSSSKKKDQVFKVLIKHASRPDLYQLQQFLRGKHRDAPQETIQVLDIVLRASPSDKYADVGRSFFHPSLGGTGELGDGLEYWRGYYQSFRPTQMGLSFNVDVSARAFFESIPVYDFVSKHLNYSNLSGPLSDQDHVKVKKALKGIKVKLSHGGYVKNYKITGLSSQPLNQLTFTLDDKKTKISVVQYFHDKYNIALRLKDLPALQSGTDSKLVYLPMELCTIVEGQRFSKKLNKEQVKALLRATCQRPPDREFYIHDMVKKNNYSGDDVVNEFGIQVTAELTVINARVLPPPTLKYHESGQEANVDPKNGAWNMINKKMVNGGRVDFWTCVCFSSKVDPNLPFEFCQQLIQMCNLKGMVFNRKPVIPIISAQANQIERTLLTVHKQSAAKLANQQGRQLQLLIVILPDFSGSYGKIKRVCETELGIVSQCCQPRQAEEMSNQYLENVSLKINAKVGGCNTVLHDALPNVSDIPTIIFGADVTHPSPGEDSCPSIAAVVASMDWPMVTKYRGLFSAQTPREEIIQDLYKTHPDQKGGIVHSGMIREMFFAFRRATRQKPCRIIFYRDGVSEGQFSQVLLHEMDAIRKACASLEDGYLPPVTFIVVQKRHHTRIFPYEHGSRDLTDRSGNILPGTVVDTHICHPTEFDFYLNSHAGIKGTSKPTHYHVLYDENQFTADDLQTLTNNLCYTYARCTRSVSIVPPAYYAHLAAFRARNYIEGDTSDAGSTSGGSDNMSGRPVEFCSLPMIKENVKDVMFYC